jgi:hypothetical protein
MSSLDVEKLIAALGNEDNECVMEMTYEKISKMKNDILQRLRLSPQELKSMHSKLKAYRFVDELPELKYGSYIRWIPLTDPENIKLTSGGIVCEMKVGNDGIVVTCKNRFNHMFSIKMQENLIFQKITDQERVLISALSYLND